MKTLARRLRRLEDRLEQRIAAEARLEREAGALRKN